VIAGKVFVVNNPSYGIMQKTKNKTLQRKEKRAAPCEVRIQESVDKVNLELSDCWRQLSCNGDDKEKIMEYILIPLL